MFLILLNVLDHLSSEKQFLGRRIVPFSSCNSLIELHWIERWKVMLASERILWVHSCSRCGISVHDHLFLSAEVCILNKAWRIQINRMWRSSRTFNQAKHKKTSTRSSNVDNATMYQIKWLTVHELPAALLSTLQICNSSRWTEPPHIPQQYNPSTTPSYIYHGPNIGDYAAVLIITGNLVSILLPAQTSATTNLQTSSTTNYNSISVRCRHTKKPFSNAWKCIRWTTNCSH